MTLKDTLEQSAQKHGDKILMKYKRLGDWQTLTYRQFLAMVRSIAEALARECHIRPGDRVALLGSNSPEWCAIHYAITGIAAIAVPIDLKLQDQEVTHILSDSGASALLMDSTGETNVLDLADRCPNLRHVILYGAQTPELEDGKTRGIRLHDFDALLAANREHAEGHGAAYDRYHPKEEDTASFIYTSGTTGRQKGAMLTHGNFTGNFQSIDAAIEILPDDNFMVILPLHHSFAFTACLVTPIASGTQMSFVESLRTVSDNIRESSPTLVLGVPLLFEKVYNKLLAGIRANKPASLLWKLGIRNPVRKGISEKLGGRIRLMISGGAPADPKMLAGLEDLGLKTREGYGLTECSPVLTLSPYDEPIRPGSCGRILPHVEMMVFSPNAEGVGELAAKGANIMKGYYNNPAASEEVFHDGWFLTGDLGYIDADNYVFITGRKKALIVNREGKNIYPEEVEMQINQSPLILECVVLGYRDPGEAVGEHVGVIVVPDEDGIAALEAAEKRKFTEKEIEARLRAEVKKQAAALADYKHPRRIRVRWEEFNKTSTGKIKRYLYAMNEATVD
ncbi:MAG: long-chain fatty acid--CoA ligase [Lentisphaerae bacterium]|nr:long-chain fatty acid--CoA ligase [Lentisphaerota bacterium]